MSSASPVAAPRRRSLVALVAVACALALLPAARADSATSTGCATASSSAGFADVRGSVHADNVGCLVGSGIVQGFADGSFRPRESVTRAQFATMLHRLLSATVPDRITRATTSSLRHLADVSASSVHGAAIGELVGLGIVQGVGNDRFEPGRPVTRAQMATMLARTHAVLTGEQLPTGDARFPDVAGSAHTANVSRLASAGIVEGYADGRFQPGRPVTREQLASFLVRYHDRLLAPLGRPLAPVPGGPTGGPTDGGSSPSGRTDDGAFPDASTTGVTRPERLRVHDGTLNVVEDGAVVQDLLVRGKIYVSGDDVTIRNVRVEHSSFYGIQHKGEGHLLIEDTEIVATGDECTANIAGTDWTARRVDSSGCSDAFRVGDNTTIEDSYAHDLHVSDTSHNDVVQTLGGRNIRIRNNTLIGRWQRGTSVILLQAYSRPVHDAVVEGNLLSGGGYLIYVEAKDGKDQPSPTGVVIRDNVVVEGSYRWGPLLDRPSPQIDWTNNRTDQGRLLEE